MAIIVEEERQQSNTPSALGWIVVLAIVAVAGYYLFFAPAPQGIVTAPPAFQDIAAITKINFDPSVVVSSTAFEMLKQSVPEPTSTGPVPLGRANPFVAP